MKQIFSVVTLLALSVSRASVQKPPAPTAVGFINAVGVTTKTDFQIDGKSLKPAGFAEGGYASSFQVTEGNHQLTFINLSCERITTTIVAKQGASPFCVVYKVAVPQGDRAPKNLLKVVAIPNQPMAGGSRFFVFSTLENRVVPLRVNGRDITVEPLRLTALEGASLTVQDMGTDSVRYETPEVANYVLVLFDGSNSRTRSVLVEMPR